MTTHEQDHAIESLSLRNGGAPVQVADGYEDGCVKATVKHGPEYRIDRFGGTQEIGMNWSVRWDQR